MSIVLQIAQNIIEDNLSHWNQIKLTHSECTEHI